MVTLAPGSILLGLVLSLGPRAQEVDEPVADVAAFYLESCTGVSARELRSCQAGVTQNRARIGASLYLGRVELGRFYSVRGQRSVFRVLPYGSGRGGVELNFVLGAEPMAEAADACLALADQGRSDYWHRLDAPMDASVAASWQKRIDQLLARSPMPALNVEVLFRVSSTARVGPIGPCAIGEPLLLRLLDGETGEVLAAYENPHLPAGLVPPRPSHLMPGRDLAGNDPRSSYLASVRERIARALPPKTSTNNPVVTVRVKIGEDGSVLGNDVERSSGDSRVDRVVADAVRRASPLPAPPVGMRQEMKQGGVLVEFRP